MESSKYQDELPGMEKEDTESWLDSLASLSPADRLSLRDGILQQKDELDDLLDKLNYLSELEAW